MFLNGQLSTTWTAVRYMDFVTEEQLLVVFNPVYVPRYGERVEFMWHGTKKKSLKDGFQKFGYVQSVESFYDCNESLHEITINLDRISNVE